MKLIPLFIFALGIRSVLIASKQLLFVYHSSILFATASFFLNVNTEQGFQRILTIRSQ